MPKTERKTIVRQARVALEPCRDPLATRYRDALDDPYAYYAGGGMLFGGVIPGSASVLDGGTFRSLAMGHSGSALDVYILQLTEPQEISIAASEPGWRLCEYCSTVNPADRFTCQKCGGPLPPPSTIPRALPPEVVRAISEAVANGLRQTAAPQAIAPTVRPAAPRPHLLTQWDSPGFVVIVLMVMAVAAIATWLATF